MRAEGMRQGVAGGLWAARRSRTAPNDGPIECHEFRREVRPPFGLSVTTFLCRGECHDFPRGDPIPTVPVSRDP